MKLLFLASWIVVFSGKASAQELNLADLHRRANDPKEDTTKVLALNALADYYGFNQFDSSIFYARLTIALSEKINYPYGSFLGLRSLFFAYNCQGNYSNALEVTLQNYKIVEKIKKERPHPWSIVHYLLGVLNREMENFPAAISQFHQTIQLSEETEGPNGDVFPSYSQLALVYQKLKRPDSAFWCARKGYELSQTSKKYLKYSSLASLVLGNMYLQSHQFELAKKYLFIGAQQSRMYKNTYFLARSYYSLANLLKEQGYPDSCIYYARISLQLCQEHDFNEYALDASSLLTKVFESQNKPDSTYKYMRILLAAKDSVFSPSKMQKFQQFVFNEEQRQQQIQKGQEQYNNRIKTYALLSGMIILLLIAFILWRNNRQKQKAYTLLQKQKQETDRQRLKAEQSLQELKSAQTQLIQSEKMASLGELTAGIAHEIQNPLNFVNNFSEVNKELLVEMKDEMDKGNLDEAIAIAKDVIENEEKITHHGKRADAIVKGMLQHSRASTGQKEPTDINVLTDEYLRLSYHGLRAKDKSFNATLETNFDPDIGNINIIPQDVGRVILNLFTNAFYSVAEKKKQQTPGGFQNDLQKHIGRTETLQGLNNYEPTVSVSTRKMKDKVEILVRDNGMGIPPKVVDKIFQPFFSTKPTGQGTGLGLSLSYDIIKAHGGELKVETKEGEFAEFIIHLPLL